MEDKNEIDSEQQDLINIIISMVSRIKMNVEGEVNFSYEDAIKKMNDIKVEDEELKHFVFFMKNLFLDKDGKSDLDTKKLIDIISLKAFEYVINSLIKCIKSKNFLDFILLLGEIFADIYFKLDKIGELIDEYYYKGLNNYEIMFRLFSLCKKNKETKYIIDNYNIYYSDTYSSIISYNLVFANNIYINALISDSNYNKTLEIINEEDNTTDNSKDKTYQMNNIEKYIYKCLIIFLCNSFFLYSTKLTDFVCLFNDFLLRDSEDNNKIIISNNKYDDENMKLYLEFIFDNLEDLFMDFNEHSMKEFSLNLYRFLDSHKNDKIDFVDKTLKIGKYNLLNEEEIGLLSISCINHKTIKKIKNLAESYSNCSMEELEQIEENKGLSDQEIYMLNFMVDEIKNSLKEESNKVNDDTNNNISGNIINIQKEEIQPISETKEKVNQTESESKLINFDDDPKYQQLMSIINKMKDQHDKEIGIMKEQHDKEISMMKGEIGIMKDNIDSLNQKINNLKKDNEKEITKLNKKIERLNNIHKIIYFRDVSKYYIRQFAKSYKIPGESISHICQNIMKLNFSTIKAESMKDIIIKIVSKYENGNRYAHMEYFITKKESLGKKDLAKEIEDSYMKFMRFSADESDKLKKKFKIINAPFISYYKLKDELSNSFDL